MGRSLEEVTLRKGGTPALLTALVMLALAVSSSAALGVGEAAPSLEGAAPRVAGQRGVDTDGRARRPVFVMVPKGVHPYFEPVYRGFEAAAAKYGVEAEIDAPPRFDVALQVKLIEGLIARGVNGVAVSADDDAGLVAVVHEAMRAGIKVITFDAPAPSSDALTYIGTDNAQAGYEAGLRMAEAMGYAGELAILQGGMQATNLNRRTEGLKRALAEVAPRIAVVAVADEHGDFSESIIRTEALLREYPGLRGIFSVSAEGAPAAAAVVKSLDRAGSVVVAGFDDLPDTLEGIRDGSVAFCVVQNTFRMGWLSVETLLDAAAGRPVPSRIDTGVLFVDRRNIAVYRENSREESAQQQQMKSLPVGGSAATSKRRSQ